MTDGEIPVALEPDERVDLVARMDGALVVLTDHRVVVQEGDRTALDVDLGGIRRIEFDLERGRAATLILVPHDPRLTPQVLTVPDEALEEVATALGVVGRRLRAMD